MTSASHRPASPTVDSHLVAAGVVVNIVDDRVRAAGVLDSETVAVVLTAADRLFTRGCRNVTLDLTHTRTVDSDAVRELFTAQQDTAPGRRLRLVAPPRLRPRLAVCRLEEPATVTEESPAVGECASAFATVGAAPAAVAPARAEPK
jgi:anti-anti-sigma regulatory factor